MIDNNAPTYDAPSFAEVEKGPADLTATEDLLYEGINGSELEVFADEPVDWIVDWAFSSDQPTLFGARSKAGKTTQLVDLSIALATKTDWLDHFKVSRARRVLFITGESNKRAISRRIKKALNARNLSFQALEGMLRVEAVNFPLLPSVHDQARIQAIVKKYGIEVVIIDPLYRGLGELDTHRMAEVGQAIVLFTKACLPASLIISHHTTKSAARENSGPPELEDMSGAGIAESCGNWWLLGRNEEYEADGMHDLCVRYGGRDEQSGLKRIIFNENNWTWEVQSLIDYQREKSEMLQQANSEKKTEQIEADIRRAKDEIETALRNEKTPLSKSSIKDLCPKSPVAKHKSALAEMIKQLIVTEAPYIDSQNRLQNSGYILNEYHEEYLAKYHGTYLKEWEKLRLKKSQTKRS